MPWKSGQGGYGTYEYTKKMDESEMIETNLTQLATHGFVV